MLLTELLDLIEKTPDLLVLFANRRLSTFVKYHYEKRKLAEQKSAVWPTPKLLPLNGWVKNCYDEMLATGLLQTLLLSEQQALFLFEDIIRNHSAEDNLLKPRRTAKLAMDAWRLLQQWSIPLQKDLFQSSIDCLTFYQWAVLFNDYCEQHQYIDNARLIKTITKVLPTSTLSLPQQFAFVGFDEVTPDLDLLILTLQQGGINTQQIHLTQQDPLVYKLAVVNNEEEIVTMARFAKKIAMEHEDAYIACVVPNLHQLRKQIEQQFTAIFTNTAPIIPFNISGGEPLICHPIISIAFTILKLYHQPIDINQLTQLLQTPFIAYAGSEMNQRAQLDVAIRNHGEQTLSLSRVIDFCENNTLQRCPQLAATLQAAMEYLHCLPEKKPLGYWIHVIKDLLNIMGWPGERTLSSEEYQYVQRFMQLLVELTSLDQFGQLFSYGVAVNQLFNLAKETLFQSKNEAMNVQVLGLLEATGTPFDYLWVMNLHDGIWPLSANPNPFIPHSLQRQHSMPHSSADRELAFSRTITERLSTNAKQCIFSYPSRLEDQLLFPSPLLTNYTLSTIENLNLEPYIPKINSLIKTRELQAIEDYFGPALSEDNTTGGTKLFRLQSLCPFRAFSEIRLKASAFENPELGLKALERGNLIHYILESVWVKLKSQATLLKLTPNEMEKLIDPILQQHLASFESKRKDTSQKRFLLIEKKRLKKIILRWLDYEKTREDFSVVETEQQREITFSGMKIKMKVDRVDVLADGSYCIIDYKSNKVSISGWFGARLEEPQLPLYCITHPQPVSTLLYAQVRQDEMVFKGITENEQSGPHARHYSDLKMTPPILSWQQQCNSWQENLTQLAEQFKKGYAVIDPKNKNACQFCELETLCRKADDEKISWEEYNDE